MPKSYIFHLSNLFTKCYEENYVPTQWTNDITVFIPKPNTPPTPDGFRPITLLAVEYKIIPNTQNGATANKGCDTSLWHYICTIQDAQKYKKNYMHYI